VRPLRPLATLGLGFLWAWWPLRDYDRSVLPAAFDERSLVTAELEGLPQRRGADEYFTATIRPLRAGTLPATMARAVVRWRSAPPLHAGERWRLLVQLQSPVAATNPGSANLAAQWLRLRVHASGQVLPSALNTRLGARAHSLDRWRERIAAAIEARVAERDAAALMIALAVGDTQRVSPEQWRVFNAAGITHLVAISGLHVTLFCQLCAALTGLLWDRCPPVQRRLPRHSCSALVGLMASLGYSLLAGWSVPTQRTLLMLATWHGLRALARPRPAARTLAAGLCGVLLLDPLAPLAAGFWLSFLAVAVLLLQGALSPLPTNGWRAILKTQGYVTTALVPVTIAVFGSVPVAGLLVNLAAIPFFSLLLVPLVLAATAALPIWPAAATWAFELAAWLIGAAWPALHAAASSPAALLRAAPPSWWYALAAAGLFVALLPWRPWMRASAALALLPAVMPSAARVPDGSFAATVFDVGRSEAVLVRTARHALLFDDGESWGSNGAVAAGRLVPALHYYGVRRLDALLLPRLDGDRGAGALALAASLPLGALLAGALRELPPEFAPCRAGARWRWDDVDLEMLDGEGCALRVRADDCSLTLPGAAHGASPSRWLTPRATRRSAVLWPATAEFSALDLERTGDDAPQVALFSTTARAAQSPRPDSILRAWRAAGARVYVTGSSGAIELRCAGGGVMSVGTWRNP
jgi:competence protein ComEC